MKPFLIGGIIACIVFAAIALFGAYRFHKGCAELGGIAVRGMGGNICLIGVIRAELP